MALDPHEHARINALIQKLDLVERKVDFLFRHLNIGFVDQRPPPTPVEQMVLEGNAMGEIKLYQQQTGAGLVDAKRTIDELRAKLGV